MKKITYSIILSSTVLLAACSRNALDEVPLDRLSPENAFNSPAAFTAAIAGLHQVAQAELTGEDSPIRDQLIVGTDQAIKGQGPIDKSLYNYSLLNSSSFIPDYYWTRMYTGYLPKANLIIAKAEEKTALFPNEGAKNAVIAEAKFFRAYAHYYLANLFGPVPIVEEFYTKAKFDFVRSPVPEVLTSAMKDLQYASNWLPATTTSKGRIVKAAADHLLTAVYLQLGMADSAIASSSRVIGDARYGLMKVRFGSEKDKPGDAYSDLFKLGNQNLAANTETIWAVQYENLTVGGGSDYGAKGNHILRCWGPAYFNQVDPTGNQPAMILVDSMGRGVGWNSPTNYMKYDLWGDADMRNSQFNIRREFVNNNNKSTFFGQKIVFKSTDLFKVDTLLNIFPTWRKIEGIYAAGLNTGRTFTDFYKMRLAETYLLRAEAYFKKGELQKAADDINAVRGRANAKAVLLGEVNMDYILDERARELFIEETRRITLNRVGMLYERTKKYNPEIGPGMTTDNVLWPIPISNVQLNTGAPFAQNKGYN